MKVLKIILIIIVVIVGGSALYFATLDGKYDVQRTTFIDATPEAVFAEVSDFKTWPNWSPWFEKDTAMTVIYGEPSKGEGATYSWKSETQGNGKMTIISAKPSLSMETRIDFEGMGSSNGYWKLEPTNGGTNVVWGFKGEMPFFFRFMASDMDAQVGGDFEHGLANLKNELESRKPAIEITEVNLKPAAIYYTHHEISTEELNQDFFSNNYQQIIDYLGDDAKAINGAPCALYFTWDEVNKTTVIDVAMPCASTKTGNKVVLKGETPSGKMLKAVHIGPYETSGETHYAIDNYMLENGIEMNGPAMEVYVIGPASGADPSHWETEIYYPIK